MHSPLAILVASLRPTRTLRIRRHHHRIRGDAPYPRGSSPRSDRRSLTCARCSGDEAYEAFSRAGTNMTNRRWRPTRSTRSTARRADVRSPHDVGDRMTRRRSGDVPVHRHRGVDPAVGSRRGRDADSAGRAHDQALRETIAAHTGLVVQAHRRRGVRGVRRHPSAAVDAAVAAQRTLELPVRMGIATGEAELRDDDYFGPVLNRAARVMACGHGGQILIDGATALLINGFELIELGPTAITGPRPTGRHVSGPSCRPANRFPAAEDSRSGAGKLAPPDHQLRRT